MSIQWKANSCSLTGSQIMKFMMGMNTIVRLTAGAAPGSEKWNIKPTVER